MLHVLSTESLKQVLHAARSVPVPFGQASVGQSALQDTQPQSSTACQSSSEPAQSGAPSGVITPRMNASVKYIAHVRQSTRRPCLRCPKDNSPRACCSRTGVHALSEECLKLSTAGVFHRAFEI